MRFSLLLLLAVIFSFDANAAAVIVNRNCNPEMAACMADVQRKFGIQINSDREVANAQCLAQFNECSAANGGITQRSGRVAQMYHPANPTFIECRKTISDPNSDAFTACMRGQKPAAKAPPVTVSSADVVIGSCSKQNPEKCTTMLTCTYSNGVWDGKSCTAAPCPQGSVADTLVAGNCRCLSDVNVSIARGTEQQCPSACRAEDHQVYNNETRTCACAEGYRDPSGLGVCMVVTAPAPTSTAQECLRELQEKVTSCNSAASTAVDKCNPDRENDDTINTLQNLLKGTTTVMGASENCAQAAVAGSTGYYALDELRGKCDTEISSCKTSCSDATSFINANKDRVYQECRKKEYDYLSCRFDNPFPAAFTENEWNVEWDKVNKSEFEKQIQKMQGNIADNNAKCESGTAVTNRSKMTDYMTDMDSAFKSASQCECQLSSGGTNCNNLVGPKDCAANPTLPGCTNAQVNCLSPSDNSPKCVCFRNPNGDECKNIRAAAVNVKPNSNINGFAGTGGMAPANGSAETSGGGGGTGVGIDPGDLSGMNSNEIAAGGASGTATADSGSPFGAANAAGGSGGGGNLGSGESNTATGEGESSAESKLRGMFNTAKGALGNLFNDKKSNSSSDAAKNSSGNGGLDANGNPMDPTQWRPRGKMIRGLASGNDAAIAGKFEDIWKVMNRQYKVQDQRDLFIFGEKK